MNSASGVHSNFESNFDIVRDGEDVSVIRREKGKFYRGKFQSSNRFQEFEIRCSFQPITGRETMQLPEGERLKSHIKIYTEFQILRDDIIVRGEEKYEVQSVMNWGTFTKSIARLMDVERD